MFHYKIINSGIVESTVHKLIKDTCKKTDFSFNIIIYEQTDGASMILAFGSVVANIIIAELEIMLLKKNCRLNY